MKSSSLSAATAIKPLRFGGAFNWFQLTGFNSFPCAFQRKQHVGNINKLAQLSLSTEISSCPPLLSPHSFSLMCQITEQWSPNHEYLVAIIIHCQLNTKLWSVFHPAWFVIRCGFRASLETRKLGRIIPIDDLFEMRIVGQYMLTSGWWWWMTSLWTNRRHRAHILHYTPFSQPPHFNNIANIEFPSRPTWSRHTYGGIFIISCFLYFQQVLWKYIHYS